jgi:hypothetical protein
VTIFEDTTVAQLAVHTGSIWIVLHPADALSLYVAQPTVWYWISGTLLSLP